MRKQVAQGRQAYIVYPVIEGAKDDQPELDFSHDEASRRRQDPAPAGKNARARAKQPTCFRFIDARSESHSKVGAQVRS